MGTQFPDVDRMLVVVSSVVCASIKALEQIMDTLAPVSSKNFPIIFFKEQQLAMIMGTGVIFL
jgi:pseudouridine-5'-phosphate glycosidase